MNTLVKGPLTVAEQEFLAQCEDTIDAGLMTFVEVGQALVSIRDNRLYRAEFSTFEDYCIQRWQMSARRANQLVSAAEVVGTIVPTGLPAPTNEAQARELARVPEPERAEIWEKTLEATGGKPTAAAVRVAAKGTRETSTPADDRHSMPVTTDQPARQPAEAADPVPAAGADGAELSPVPSAPLPLEDGSTLIELPTAASRNRRPLPESFDRVTGVTVKAVEALERLVKDDRFPRNAEQVGRMCRHDLLRAADLLATVIDRVPSLTKEATQ